MDIVQIMKKLHLRLIVAVLTFGIGITVWFAFNSSDSVDGRLAAALKARELKVIESIYKNCPASDAKCERDKARAESKVIERLEESIMKINLLCKENNLSDAECAQNKEQRIKNYETDMTIIP